MWRKVLSSAAKSATSGMYATLDCIRLVNRKEREKARRATFYTHTMDEHGIWKTNSFLSLGTSVVHLISLCIGSGMFWERCLFKAYREDHREWVNLKPLL